ncbi:Intradiol ring-cleavage dioxygenase [Penicillium frequentans]|uniref:Intradiol ring-cleavage dioxygenase n=1 Tax=Penicillium frequentans TaxID=3151616 RepID=A0AAD6GM40_9EURO|nr:Intradiol ring-cleavage dioxygenase [Penicillium glabrum]
MHLPLYLTAAATIMASSILAHPGEHHDDALVKRKLNMQEVRATHGSRALAKCARSQAYQTNDHFRRTSDDLDKWAAVEHNKTGKITPFGNVFDTETTCILAPVITDGPYYVWGELIRQNVVEEKYCRGVPMYLEIQYIDVNTCQPLPDLYVDIWNANSTGVYSGISESGNYAAGGWNSTYLRGIQPTDNDGVAAFDTIVPGHYSGRATHTHLLVHTNATILANGTLQINSGSITHNGQLFYDEALRSAVEASDPYNTNTIEVTSNEEDQWAPEQATSSYDPFIRYVYLGDDISDGIFAWKEIGINSTADYTNDSDYAIAAYLGANGGYENTGAHAFSGGGGSS